MSDDDTTLTALDFPAPDDGWAAKHGTAVVHINDTHFDVDPTALVHRNTKGNFDIQRGTSRVFFGPKSRIYTKTHLVHVSRILNDLVTSIETGNPRWSYALAEYSTPYQTTPTDQEPTS